MWIWVFGDSPGFEVIEVSYFIPKIPKTRIQTGPTKNELIRKTGLGDDLEIAGWKVTILGGRALPGVIDVAHDVKTGEELLAVRFAVDQPAIETGFSPFDHGIGIRGQLLAQNHT
jgi:hypothetical protein